ncbi:MAG: hypothetical protein IPJ97_15815 [Proteobacteria bacterium]|nr:hypothetical protein [Pseudomonadota bacterium]
MAGAILSARRPTLLDYQVILSLGVFGVWCIVLAFETKSDEERGRRRA